MDMMVLVKAVTDGVILPVLLAFLIWNNSKLIDKIINKLVENNKNKQK